MRGLQRAAGGARSELARGETNLLVFHAHAGFVSSPEGYGYTPRKSCL